MQICISNSIHSLFSHVLRCAITLQCTRMYVHVSDARAICIMQIDFAEVKVLRQQIHA